jgi:hypothetical protein
MNTPNYRAWRFVQEELPGVEARTGLQISHLGSIDMVSEHESIRQAIFLLLSTRPGERVMRPSYGCDLFRLVFSPMDETSIGLAIHYVRQAIQRWEPRVTILSLDASRSESEAGLLVLELHYRAKTTLKTGWLQLAVNLNTTGL